MSPMNKPQYSTRVIMNDLNPVFEECTALLVDANAPKVKENVSLQVFDSDRFTGDDIVGYVEVDVVGTKLQLGNSHD
jgi:Ca2+-dependent lipid-binding protein